MADINTSLYLRLRSDVSKTARRDARALEKMGRSGSRAFKNIGRSARRASSAIRRHGTAAARRFMGSTTGRIAAGIGVAATATAALNQAVSLEKQKAHLAATSGKAIADVERIFEAVIKNAIATGVPIEKQARLLQTMQDMGGLVDVATKNLRLLSDVIQGTGATADDVARTASVLHQVVKTKDMAKSFAILVEQGNMGNATLAETAKVFPELFSAYKSTTGRGEEEIVREVGALLQVAAQTFGNTQLGATAMRALTQRLTAQENLKQFEDAGIKTTEEDGSLRKISSILQELSNQANGDREKIAGLARVLNIGETELPFFQNMMIGGIKNVLKYEKVGGSKQTIPEQAGVNRKTTAAAYEMAKAELAGVNQKYGATAVLRLLQSELEASRERAEAERKQAKADRKTIVILSEGGPEADEALADLRGSKRPTMTTEMMQAARGREAQQRKERTEKKWLDLQKRQIKATEENTQELRKIRRDLDPFGGLGRLNTGEKAWRD